MSVTVRSATEQDVPLIAGFIRELAAYERLAREVVMTEADLRLTLFGEQRYAEVLIAEQEREPLGFALFFHTYSTFLGRPGLYLEDLFVRPEQRGRGVGLKLLAQLAGLAQERGCGRLEWSVLNWNDSAIGFYDKLGARPRSGWTVYRLTGEALQELAARA
ncbi:MAG: GNAT family N-acetyltransferase [Candidatus Dormibacter sp.]|uniref:GNAT family N-acetyltransferase n=1 Tax=Candidatus Dormibacter sp. TaxID=2973982 RepID=UPI000DB8A670|nr:MAG: N-acetyltransferase [Candidatus Dormibacteraeota bacterium]